MRLLLKIALILFAIWAWVYFFKPQIIRENTVFEAKKINIQEYTLTPKPWKLFLLNLKIISSQTYNVKWIKSATQLYMDATRLFKVNILNLLEDTRNKKLVLNTHIKQLENMESKLNEAIVSLSSLEQQEQTKSQEFLSQKKHGDSQFGNGFNLKDSQMVAEGLEMSRKNWPEHVRHRILANAMRIVWSRLKNIKSLISAKLLLLQNNQETIVVNYELIKWNLLEKLLELKKRLESERYN